MKIRHLRIGGRCGLDPTHSFVRTIPLLSYHHRERMCWLWILELRRCMTDEKRAIRYFRMAGFQDHRVWQFWAWSVRFIWQEEGRWRDVTHQRREKLSRLLGTKFEDPRK